MEARRQEQRRQQLEEEDQAPADRKCSWRDNVPGFAPPWGLCDANHNWPLGYPDIKHIQSFYAGTVGAADKTPGQRRAQIINFIAT